MLLLVEVAVTEYRTQISGVEVIFDLEGLSLQHICQIGPSFASAAVHWAQVCMHLSVPDIATQHFLGFICFISMHL